MIKDSDLKALENICDTVIHITDVEDKVIILQRKAKTLKLRINRLFVKDKITLDVGFLALTSLLESAIIQTRDKHTYIASIRDLLKTIEKDNTIK